MGWSNPPHSYFTFINIKLTMMSRRIKTIIEKALNVERWAPKSTETYSFLEKEEIEEMATNVIKQLEEKGYQITKCNE
jgi:hypothetical protein